MSRLYDEIGDEILSKVDLKYRDSSLRLKLSSLLAAIEEKDAALYLDGGNLNLKRANQYRKIFSDTIENYRRTTAIPELTSFVQGYTGCDLLADMDLLIAIAAVTGTNFNQAINMLQACMIAKPSDISKAVRDTADLLTTLKMEISELSEPALNTVGFKVEFFAGHEDVLADTREIRTIPDTDINLAMKRLQIADRLTRFGYGDPISTLHINIGLNKAQYEWLKSNERKIFYCHKISLFIRLITAARRRMPETIRDLS